MCRFEGVIRVWGTTMENEMDKKVEKGFANSVSRGVTPLVSEMKTMGLLFEVVS